MSAPAYRRLSVEQRRSQLIATALGLFAHRAPEDVTLDDVAAEAGVSRPLVYRYFPGGKQQLYEAALRGAADLLEGCFEEPPAGPPSLRLVNVLDRYLAFVEEHAAGFTALLAGGSVAETSRTTAIVDEVRRAAADTLALHLQVPPTATRVRLTLRTWIAGVEAASLIWLDEGKQPPRAELRDWLVDQFIAQLLTTAVQDEESADVVRRALAQENRDSPAGVLTRRVLPVVASAEHLL
ncbi:TetR/AcrR family transcriptional regulator [Streptomyces sp. JJ66]|uniref:TetR/AcrR family transcriptional regulator n=1 Tax=Streptomyces sp. JJ66 TaxID=2803843 RepID=UPI001C56F4BB|nr:TetR/AcrR family transcriptional regulator [Streptomyces sp. JJ66]MBW1601440.1 TetR/AcrR family transcriptional regulator [Streptomyces sp. JJ66]